MAVVLVEAFRFRSVTLHVVTDLQSQPWGRARKDRISAGLWQAARDFHPKLPPLIAHDSNGKPVGGELSVSLSYTRGAAVLGVARDGSLGVDVEHKNRILDIESIAGALGAPFVQGVQGQQLLQKCMALECVFKAVAGTGASLRSVATSQNELLGTNRFFTIRDKWMVAVCHLPSDPPRPHRDQHCLSPVFRLQTTKDLR